MNRFLGFFTISVILFSPFLKPPHVVTGRQPIHVRVQNAFTDGRAMSVSCLSILQESLASLSLGQNQRVVWSILHFNAETLHTCYVIWPTKYIHGVEFSFLAFNGSWPHGDSIRDPETRELGHGWVFNETGFWYYDFSKQRNRLMLPPQDLLSRAAFDQPVHIRVRNQFRNDRVVLISSHTNQGLIADAVVMSEIVHHGFFGSWVVSRFNTRTIHSCKVWEGSTEAVLVIEFEAFMGGWRIDESRIDSFTGEVRYEWQVNDTGVYLHNFITGLEFKRPLLRQT